MKTVDISKANKSLEAYTNNLAQEPLIVTRRGRPVAALMPLGKAGMEDIALSLSPKFMAIIERAREQRKAGLGISSREARRQLGVPERVK